MTRSSDAVSIVVAGAAWGGWEEVSITRGIEEVPSRFLCSGTERYPSQADATTVDIVPRSPCVVKIGSNTVLTGYVDLADRIVNAQQHTVEIAGRSKFCDLVDCSGFLQNWQFSNITLVQLATSICQPFGISVSAPGGDTAVMPTVSIAVTETGYERIEECARYMNRLIYDDVNGNLVIASLEENTHASGVVEGVNVQSMKGTYNAAEMMTEISAVYSDTAILSDGAGSTEISVVQTVQSKDDKWPLRADGKPRYRPLLIISEQGSGQNDVVPRRCWWEMGRRWGRGQTYTVTVDTWRDSSGNLWTPNWLIPVNLPSVKLPATTWLITQVTYIKDEQGTRAELTLMPPPAMAPMPQAPYLWSAALQDASSTPTTGAQTAPTQGG